MEIITEKMKRCELVRVSGKVDSLSAPELEETLLARIAAGQRNLVVNLGGVDYMSSAGLKALLVAVIRARRHIPPGDVVITELQPSLASTFDLVGLSHLFKFYDDDLAAVGSF